VDGLRVSASAPLAGPFDLSGLSFPFALEGKARAASMYLAYITSSYARIYGEALTSVMREPYAGRLPGLFDGTHPEEEVIAALPAQPRAMFRGDFLEDYDSGRDTWLLRRLAENSLYDWRPRAPIRLYYGSRDVDVSPEEARRQAERLGVRGSEVRAVDVGALDHNESVIAAVPMLRAWFDSLTSHGGDRPR
jgi:pimeloyl-ACP methyl ester carboxylesterase